MRLPRLLAAPSVALVLVVLSSGAAVADPTPSPSPAATPTATPTPTATATATPTGTPAPGADAAAALRTQLHATFATSTSKTPSIAVDIDGIGRVFRQGSSTAVQPASTEKLFTSLALLQAKGTTARQLTRLRTTTAITGTHQPGDLYLQAAGDPYLSKAYLDSLAKAVRDAGIRKVEGGLVIDDLKYDAVRHGTGWKSSYVPDESGPLDALAVDRNGWRSDKAYLADPGIQTLATFRTLLSNHGVLVAASYHRAHVPSGAKVLASHSSATTAEIATTTMKGSVNFGAEMAFKELGALYGDGSAKGGSAAVRKILTGMRVGVGTAVDGSGLSSQDRQTAEQEMTLLSAAQASSSYQALRAALPIACVDGTLVHRMCKTTGSGTVMAKTGTLPGVNALTGWTTTRDGHVVRFAFLLNGVTSSSKALAALDKACVQLSSFTVGS